MPDKSDSTQRQVALRLPVDLLERIDQHVARERARRPGVTYTRADAIRAFLFAQVAKAETPPPSPREPRSST